MFKLKVKKIFTVLRQNFMFMLTLVSIIFQGRRVRRSNEDNYSVENRHFYIVYLNLKNGLNTR